MTCSCRENALAEPISTYSSWPKYLSQSFETWVMKSDYILQRKFNQTSSSHAQADFPIGFTDMQRVAHLLWSFHSIGRTLVQLGVTAFWTPAEKGNRSRPRFAVEFLYVPLGKWVKFHGSLGGLVFKGLWACDIRALPFPTHRPALRPSLASRRCQWVQLQPLNPVHSNNCTHTVGLFQIKQYHLQKKWFSFLPLWW